MADFIYNREPNLWARDPAPPMAEAVKFDRVDAIEYLNNLLPKTDLQQFVNSAVERNAVKSLRYLLGHGALPDVGFGGVQTPLCAAASKGLIDAATILIEFGANINLAFRSETPLHTAAERGHTEFVKLLLRYGATMENRNRTSRTPLLEACINGQVESARVLLDAGADFRVSDDDALTKSIANDYAAVVELLLDHYYATHPPQDDCSLAEKYRSKAFDHTIMRGSEKTLRMLLARGVEPEKRDRLGQKLLESTALHGHPKLAAILLDWGVPIDARAKNGNTPLMSAKTAEAAKHLLDNGANVNAVAGRSGRTPLACAAKDGRLTTLRELLSRGAHINAVDHRGRTALMRAAVSGYDGVISELITQGADVHATDRLGWTALMHAASNRNLTVARTLLKAGADVHAVDSIGRTAVQLVNGNNKWELARILGVEVPQRKPKKNKMEVAAQAAPDSGETYGDGGAAVDGADVVEDAQVQQEDSQAVDDAVVDPTPTQMMAPVADIAPTDQGIQQVDVETAEDTVETADVPTTESASSIQQTALETDAAIADHPISHEDLHGPDPVEGVVEPSEMTPTNPASPTNQPTPLESITIEDNTQPHVPAPAEPVAPEEGTASGTAWGTGVASLGVAIVCSQLAVLSLS
ncbi:ankyrin [Gonapodya prolifera JEL478]|uniref:Ankyrin n=1 Tax=Gonapodya prolifera (strain JEL478) TaxID=1344416 RepID=A0A138ZXX0_GONPJ|nr:ankyrin [Gonapodya prolifera JEL478]|eukprot:KXS09350.1 ankyrin [Gonapodya prolifera JEL478]